MLSSSARQISRRGFVTATAPAAASIPSLVGTIMGNMSSPGPAISLTEEFPFDGSASIQVGSSLPDPEITTLDNGVRVVTQDTYQAASSLGILVDAGSRDESAANMGVTHLLEKMAFQSSNEFSKARIMYEIEMMGARDCIFANRSRESMIYGADCLKECSGDMMTVLMECVFNPAYDATEVEEQKAMIADVDLKSLEDDPHSQTLEAFHAAAYGGSTLGLPMYAQSVAMNQLGPQDLFDFKETNFTADNIVLAGASVDHDLMVSFAQEYLGGLGKSTGSSAAAAYTGGEQYLPGFGDEAVMAVGFEGVGYNHDDMIYFHALHMMMGGGSSFSAGGPGKGLYSRLYTNVLNRHNWVSSASAFNVQYADTGVFGFIGSTHKEDMASMSAVLVEQLVGMAQNKASDEEMGRIKNMLKSFMLMNYESRVVVMEDLGRSMLADNKITAPSVLCAKVDAMAAEDLQRVALQMLKSKVTVSGHGDTSKIASAAEIEGAIRGK